MFWRTFLKDWWAAQSSPEFFIKADKVSWSISDRIFKLATWAIAIGALKALHVKTQSPDIAFVAKWLGILWMWLVTITFLAIMYRMIEYLPKFPQDANRWVKAVWYFSIISVSLAVSTFISQYAINETTRIFAVVVDIIAKGSIN